MLYTAGSIVSVFMCGLCPFFVVDHVRFYLWIVSASSCGFVHLCLWIVSAFSCGLCPRPHEQIQCSSSPLFCPIVPVRLSFFVCSQRTLASLCCFLAEGCPRRAPGSSRSLCSYCTGSPFLFRLLPADSVQPPLLAYPRHEKSPNLLHSQEIRGFLILVFSLEYLRTGR